MGPLSDRPSRRFNRVGVQPRPSIHQRRCRRTGVTSTSPRGQVTRSPSTARTRARRSSPAAAAFALYASSTPKPRAAISERSITASASNSKRSGARAATTGTPAISSPTVRHSALSFDLPSHSGGSIVIAGDCGSTLILSRNSTGFAFAAGGERRLSNLRNLCVLHRRVTSSWRTQRTAVI